ncbi:MAG: Rieske 2Fe-2S domain-containing protein [Sphingomonadaceae bacterium]
MARVDALQRPEAGPVLPAAALADRTTPLIRNCWYVAATSAELLDGPLGVDVAGVPVALFRTRDGKAAAVHDRCAHRSFPLSRGRVEGDRLVCGYHGIAYGADGLAAAIPADDRPAARAAMRVRRFPLIERPPFLWLWPGDPDAADPALVPAHPWLSDPGWAFATGRTDIEANYLGLHENLLDTTHFSFLHAGNVGTPSYATAPIDLEVAGDRVRQVRVLAGDVLPGLYDRAMELVGKPVTRSTDSRFVSPGWHEAHAEVIDPDPAPGRPARYATKILHAITPTAQDRTRYWWAIARDYRVDEPEVTSLMRHAIVEAFEEDRLALAWIREVQDRDGLRPVPAERSVKPDMGGLAMRRIVARLAAREAEAG